MVVISHNILYVVFSCAFKHNHPILSGSKTLISNSGQSPNIYNTPRLANFYHSMNSVTKVFHLLLGIFFFSKASCKKCISNINKGCVRGRDQNIVILLQYWKRLLGHIFLEDLIKRGSGHKGRPQKILIKFRKRFGFSYIRGMVRDY